MSGITNIKYISSFKLGDQVVLDDRTPYEGLEDLGLLPRGHHCRTFQTTLSTA